MAELKRRAAAGGEAQIRISRRALDLDAYMPARLAFLANRISSSAASFGRRVFGVGILDWRILAPLACEPGIAPARVYEALDWIAT